MPLAGRSAALKVTSLTATTSTGNAATRSTGTGGETGYVQISSTARRHWDPDSTPALYLTVGATTSLVSSTNYSVNAVQGKFQWVSGDPSTGTYTADVEYLTASNVAGGREWQLNLESDMFEVSEFGSSGWKEYLPNLNGATVTVARYWEDSTFFDYMALDAKFIAELIVNSTAGWRYEGFVRIQSDQVGAGVDAIVGEALNLQVDGALYFTT